MRTSVLAVAALAFLLPASAGAQAPAGQAPPGTTTTQTTTKTQTTTATSTRETTNRPTWEFSLAYQFLRTGQFCAAFDASDCTEDNPKEFPIGFFIDGARNFGGVFGLVVEAGLSHDKESGDSPFDDFLTSDIFHAGAGVRIGGRPGRVWPYAQVIGGVAVSDFDGQVAGRPFNDTRTRVMAQGGGGITFVVGDGWGIFLDGAYRRMFLDEEEDFTSGRNDVRAAIGFRMILD